MELLHNALTYGPEFSHVSIHKEVGNNITVHADIVLLTEKFLEYQRTILDEFFAQLFDLTYSENVLFDEIIDGFEMLLQALNTKLETFAGKINDVPYFDIRGSIQLFHHQDYIASLIGDVTLLVVRGEKVQYTLHNDVMSGRPVALFSDFIQGDVFSGDQIFIVGGDITQYFDHYELQEFVDGLPATDDVIGYTRDTLKQRCAVEDLGIISSYGIALPKAVRIAPKNIVKMLDTSGLSKIFSGVKVSDRWVTFMRNSRELMGQYRYAIVIGLFSIFLLYLLVGLVSNFIKNNTTNTINADGTITASLSIEDIKKEIVQFQKLDPSTPEKITKYNALKAQLDALTAQGKRTNDVAQLKTILNTEYYRGFNIILVNSLTDQNVYTFSSLEKNTMGIPLSIFYNKSFTVAGDKGMILGGISDDVRGNNITYSLGMTAKTCTLNLLKDGVYCASTTNTVFNTTKAGSEDVKVNGGNFPEGIIGVGTFGSSNFYVLLKNTSLANDGVYMMKYSNMLGSQVTLNQWVLLNLGETSAVADMPNGFSTFAIDGTFLLWSYDKKTLYQMSRNSVGQALMARPVPLNGGTNIGDGYSEFVKPISFGNSKYVYLFDKKNQTFTVYLSNPVKTNDAYTAGYGLNYIMRLNFAIANNSIIDVTVDESNGKQMLYVLHNEGVAQFNISDYISNFAQSAPTN